MRQVHYFGQWNDLLEEAREPFGWKYPGGSPIMAEIRTFEKYVEIQTRLRGGPGCLLESDDIFTINGEEKIDFRDMVATRKLQIAAKKTVLKPFIDFL